MLRACGAGVGPQLLRAALGLGAWPGPERAASGTRGQGWLQPAGHDTGVKVYNSLTRRKDPLIVGSADAASWYSCGPTVYDHAHLGHACSYVRFDIIRRILTRVFGCNIIMVMGITDVDDKIIKRAGEMNVSPASLANLYEENFKQDMAALKVLPPTVYLRVTENIPHIISFIEGIIANGHAYSTAQGNVYFDLRSRGDRYGKLVGAVPSPTAEPVDSDKRHPSDFALWKAAKPREVFWASPWGNGRPGWHIECSTISSLVFGSRLDIHSGGMDLAFPHHENEIAQCEAFHQCRQWGNYFLHSGHLHVKGKEEKMSKSLKNYITVKDFLKTFSPDVFRLFCMRSSYRSAVDYSDGTMLEAKHLLLAAAAFIEDARAYMKGQLVCGPVGEGLLWERLRHTREAVKAALADDFDTPAAVDAVMDLIHRGNGQLQARTKRPFWVICPRSPVVPGVLPCSAPSCPTLNTSSRPSGSLWRTDSSFQATTARPLSTAWWRSWSGSGSRSGSSRWPVERPPGRPSGSSGWTGSPCWRHVTLCARTSPPTASALRTGAARPRGSCWVRTTDQGAEGSRHSSVKALH
ncbi:probable cysteine--tRNA ligase, mitochondrial isoform X1 [Prionailurus viverrinus]|uniref:probable cysteine--tRNA ligase, mitochondrial isoform X1 n=1 Tax=Prionailurus bengalensis TaxID=37029 RepID=UPI001CAA3146|nr:probable cysteine--tRNA ligase, mitochondrial isoform X1 [Prionailurus bengalensis]XP_047717936.1 probable cysteine--tRNA ligase, mitochondrial isoform X1 [Prionailurus viverrinus]